VVIFWSGAKSQDGGAELTWSEVKYQISQSKYQISQSKWQKCVSELPIWRPTFPL
jgi:hypothetical protein